MEEIKPNPYYKLASMYSELIKAEPDEEKKNEMKMKLIEIVDLAQRIEKGNKNIEKIEAKIEQIDNESAEGTVQETEEFFDDYSEEEKIELEDTISVHLKRALELLKEKALEVTKAGIDKIKQKMVDLGEGCVNTYNAAREYKMAKFDEIKQKLEEQKEEKRKLKEQTIEKLKQLSKDKDIDIKKYSAINQSIKEDLETVYDEKDKLEDNLNPRKLKKVEKGMIKYQKKNFINRFIENFAELGKRPEISYEDKKEMFKNLEVVKTPGFFAKAKQAFSKAREQGKEYQVDVEMAKEDIMRELEVKLEEKNRTINEYENLFETYKSEIAKLDEEKKENMVQILKTGKLGMKEFKEMVENEIILCSNPTMIMAKAKVADLKDKFADELNKNMKKKASRNGGIYR